MNMAEQETPRSGKPKPRRVVAVTEQRDSSSSDSEPMAASSAREGLEASRYASHDLQTGREDAEVEADEEDRTPAPIEQVAQPTLQAGGKKKKKNKQ